MIRTALLASPCLALLALAQPSPAAAQDAGEILGSVLDSLDSLGGGNDEGDLGQRAARACADAAEDDDLEVRDIRDARRVGENDVEVTMRVEEHGEDEIYRCTYDQADQRVEDMEHVGDGDRRMASAYSVDEDLADEAGDACAEVAEDRRYDDIDIDEISGRSRDLVEVRMEARDRDDEADLTCLYDVRKREAYLAQ